jgi:hypothetical protein
MLTERRTLGPPVSVRVDSVGVLTPSAARASFPSQEWIKGMESTGKLTFPLHPSLLNFVSFSPVLYLLLNLRPSPMVMASDLPPSRYQTACDLRKPRKVIGWQSPGYDSKMRHGIVSLANMQPGDFVFLSSYALSGLVPPLSMLLEHYGLNFSSCHRTPHWWRSSSTSARCSWECDRRCACSAASTCCMS